MPKDSKETVPCVICGTAFERYKNRTQVVQTCRRECGFKLIAQNATGRKVEGRVQKREREEREAEEKSVTLHRAVLLGVDCPYGEGFIL